MSCLIVAKALDKTEIFENRPISEIEIIRKHVSSTLSATSPHRNIAAVYWLHKLQKQPFKFCFISTLSKKNVLPQTS
jgi:hypothetical protein